MSPEYASPTWGRVSGCGSVRRRSRSPSKRASRARSASSFSAIGAAVAAAHSSAVKKRATARSRARTRAYVGALFVGAPRALPRAPGRRRTSAAVAAGAAQLTCP